MDRTPYGVHIVISGNLTDAEVMLWYEGIVPTVTPTVYNLVVLLDVVDARPFHNSAKKHLLNGLETLLDSNLIRVSITYQSYAVYTQVKNLLIKAGVKQYRFFNSSTPAFRRLAREWMINGTIDESEI